MKLVRVRLRKRTILRQERQENDKNQCVVKDELNLTCQLLSVGAHNYVLDISVVNRGVSTQRCLRIT